MKSRVLVTVFILISVAVGFAQIPKTMVYQGKLTGTTGIGLTGNYDLDFAIYNDEAAGILLWTESYTGVDVEKGLFSVMLGENVPLDIPFDEQYWLEIGIDGTLLPRMKLASEAYAMRAGIADSADAVTWEMLTEYVKAMNDTCIHPILANDSTAYLLFVDDTMLIFRKRVDPSCDATGILVDVWGHPTITIAAAVYDTVGLTLWALGDTVGVFQLLSDSNGVFILFNGDTIAEYYYDSLLVSLLGTDDFWRTLIDTLEAYSDWNTLNNIPPGFADNIDNVGFQQLRADANPWLPDSATFVAGENVVITQTGDSIEITAPNDNDWAIVGDDMYSVPTGNVGIGTETPAEKLDVDGNIHASGIITSGSSIAIDGTIEPGTITESHGKISFVNDTIVTKGWLGAGTSSPERALHVNDIIRIQPRETAPLDPALGDIYVGTNGKIYFFNGTQWYKLDMSLGFHGEMASTDTVWAYFTEPWAEYYTARKSPLFTEVREFFNDVEIEFLLSDGSTFPDVLNHWHNPGRLSSSSFNIAFSSYPREIDDAAAQAQWQAAIAGLTSCDLKIYRTRGATETLLFTAGSGDLTALVSDFGDGVDFELIWSGSFNLDLIEETDWLRFEIEASE